MTKYLLHYINWEGWKKVEDIAVSFKAMTWKSLISLLFTYHLSELNLMVTSSYKLLLLSHFSRVLLCATPWTAAHQTPLSLGFSRQEHWSGLPFPSPVHESEVAQSCPTLGDPMDYSLPGSSVHGIFQAKVLEWVAIVFSTSYKRSREI